MKEGHGLTICYIRVHLTVYLMHHNYCHIMHVTTMCGAYTCVCMHVICKINSGYMILIGMQFIIIAR